MARAPEPTARVPRWKRWLKRLAWTALAGSLLLAGFVIWVWTTCFAEPPPLSGRPAILDAPLVEADGRRRIGNCWFLPRPGHSLLYLEGDPFTLGYANAALTADRLAAQERSLIENVRRILPGTLGFYGAALLVLVHNRNLPQFIRRDIQLEIRGLSESHVPDPYPQFGSRYHRILNYHAAHDISHWVLDTPALGCTSFAATGARTRDGHLIVGRNFDWESGAHFDTEKVIALYRPSRGRAFLSVSWPGMAGAVTGLNDARIFCSLNGAHSADMGLGVGRPVSLVIREILQSATDLESATAVIRQAPVFVADSFLLADGKTGRAIVVEKTPTRCAVRAMHGDWLLQSNHFETPELAGDPGNLEYMRDGTSVARRDRLAELLARVQGRIDPVVAATILRDRRGVGDQDRGLGHRTTINPMIATHSVVADVTAGVLWVSRGRHQLGTYDAYAIAGFGRPAADPIAADPAWTDGSYARLTTYRTILAELEPALATGRPLAAVDRRRLEEAAQLNPLAPEVSILLAEDLERRGEPAAALQRYRAALAAYPPFRPDRERVAVAIRRLTTDRQP